MTAGVRLSDPDTSRTAAESLEEVLRPEQDLVYAAVIFVHIWNDGHGATSWEVQRRLRSLGIERDQNCISSRCSELSPKNDKHPTLLEDRDVRRPGRSRRPLIAWFPTPTEGS